MKASYKHISIHNAYVTAASEDIVRINEAEASKYKDQNNTSVITKRTQTVVIDVDKIVICMALVSTNHTVTENGE
jgi:hypothetical protein